MTLWNRWKQTTIANKLLVIVGAFSAFASILSVSLFGLQTYLNQKAAEDAARQTTRIVAAVESMSARLKTANEQQFSALSNSAGESKAAIETATKTASDQLENERTTLRQEQRAWVGVKDCKVNREPAPYPSDAKGAPRPTFTKEEIDATKIELSCAIFNSGRTPAILVRQAVVSNIGSPPAAIVTDKENVTETVVFPNDTNQRMILGGITFQPPALNRYLKGERMYFALRVEYLDGFGRRHWTRSCQYRETGQPLDVFTFCGSEVGTYQKQ